jgi:rod shape-determining protein MreC
MFAPPQSLQHLRISLSNIARLPLKVITRAFNYINSISQLPYLDSEKFALKSRVRELEKELVELNEVLSENERLRSLLGLKQALKKSSIPAMVIGRDPNNWSSVVFIDKGKNDGIVKDMVAISGQGLVGRVRELGKTMAKVMLINDIDSKVGAIVQRSREQGLLIGTAEGDCKLIYLSLDSDINKGDEVLTSGTGGIYPKGVLIGQVMEIEKEKARLYKYAIVKPSSELSKLEEVLCVK